MLTFAFGVILGNFTAKGLEISKFPFVLTPDSLVTSSWLNLVLERLTDKDVLGYFQLSISASISASFFAFWLVSIINVLDRLASSALV